MSTPGPGGRGAPPHAPAPPNDIAIRFGLLGGAFASAFVVLPPLVVEGGGGALTDFAGLMVAMLAIWMGSRALGVAHPGLPYTRRLLLGSTIVALASAVVGVALYALYAWLRPGLLAERYAALEARLGATELERLAAHRAQYLDPAYQALGTAGTLFFFGTVLALYAAWRWRVVLRLQAARAAGPGDAGHGGPADRGAGSDDGRPDR